jgi:chromate transporter
MSVDLLAAFGHFAVLSLLAVGGAITTAPDMHRYLVDEHGWITDTEFTASIALAQAAPGPNVLFVPLLGWHVAGLSGALVLLIATMLPSTTLALATYRVMRRNAQSLTVKALRQGLVPGTIGLLLATGYILALANDTTWKHAGLTVLAVALIWRTKLNPLWLLAAAGGLGAAGLV